MISPVNIHPPKNWQDFETLCLKLWGEMWDIPHEIEFNSDNSQGQNGVDIFGPVDGGKCYNGIQCKNKKLNLIDGSPNRITTSDILDEINKAKSFKPALNKLIIATSLQKDQRVEEFVREQSVENVQNGLFSIQICFWDFFERKLPELPKVYDWYLKNENFHRVRQVKVTFEDGGAEKTVHPKFQKTINKYSLRTEEDALKEKLELDKIENLTAGQYLQDIAAYNRIMKQYQSTFREYHAFPEVEWKQLCWFRLLIKNTGQVAIEDYKIELDFIGNFKRVGAESRNLVFDPGFRTNVNEYRNSNTSLFIKPASNILVQEDSLLSGSIFIEPVIGVNEKIKVNWKLLSKDFSDSGELKIEIVPKYHKVVIENYVSSIEDIKDDEEKVSLIMRPSSFQIDGCRYLDKESDYNFE